MGISLFLGGSKRLPRWFGALTVFGSIQPCKMVKNGQKKKCPRVPGWVRGGVQLLFGQCPNAGCIIEYGSSLKMNSQYINTNLIPRINEWAKITSPWQVRVTSALSAFLRSSATCLPRKVSPRLPRKVFSIFAAYFRNQMISATSNCSDKSKTCPWLKLTN